VEKEKHGEKRQNSPPNDGWRIFAIHSSPTQRPSPPASNAKSLPAKLLQLLRPLWPSRRCFALRLLRLGRFEEIEVDGNTTYTAMKIKILGVTLLIIAAVAVWAHVTRASNQKLNGLLHSVHSITDLAANGFSPFAAQVVQYDGQPHLVVLVNHKETASYGGSGSPGFLFSKKGAVVELYQDHADEKKFDLLNVKYPMERVGHHVDLTGFFGVNQGQ
jgi:hypothetical protein